MKPQMEFRPLPGWPNYLIGSDGTVKNVNGHVKVPYPAKRGGYLCVSIWANNKGKLAPVHQLVAFAFHGPRPTPSHQAAHNDGNKLNCRADNIAWKTRAQNEADKLLHGTSNRGERNGQAISSVETVKEVKRLLRSGKRNRDIAAQLKREASWVGSIKMGRIWKHVQI